MNIKKSLAGLCIIATLLSCTACDKDSNSAGISEASQPEYSIGTSSDEKSTQNVLGFMGSPEYVDPIYNPVNVKINADASVTLESLLDGITPESPSGIIVDPEIIAYWDKSALSNKAPTVEDNVFLFRGYDGAIYLVNNSGYKMNLSYHDEDDFVEKTLDAFDAIKVGSLRDNYALSDFNITFESSLDSAFDDYWYHTLAKATVTDIKTNEFGVTQCFMHLDMPDGTFVDVNNPLQLVDIIGLDYNVGRMSANYFCSDDVVVTLNLAMFSFVGNEMPKIGDSFFAVARRDSSELLQDGDISNVQCYTTQDGYIIHDTTSSNSLSVAISDNAGNYTVFDSSSDWCFIPYEDVLVDYSEPVKFYVSTDYRLLKLESMLMTTVAWDASSGTVEFKYDDHFYECVALMRDTITGTIHWVYSEGRLDCQVRNRFASEDVDVVAGYRFCHSDD